MSEQPTPVRRIVVIVSRPNIVLCKSCGAEIVWGVTAGGNRACPADSEQVDGKYFSHFETCRFAGRHSKKGK